MFLNAITLLPFLQLFIYLHVKNYILDIEIPFNDVDNSDIPEQITIFDILGTGDENK